MLIPVDFIFCMVMLGVPAVFITVTILLNLPTKARNIIGVLLLVVASALAGYSFCGKNSILPRPSHNKIENIIEFNERTVTVKDPHTKEVYQLRFEPLAVGHPIRRFYDVPTDKSAYVTYDASPLAYGNVEFHMHEETE